MRVKTLFFLILRLTEYFICLVFYLGNIKVANLGPDLANHMDIHSRL